MKSNDTAGYRIEDCLKTAHDKIMQAQQKIDNRDLNEQRLLEQALDAINQAQSLIGQK